MATPSTEFSAEGDDTAEEFVLKLNRGDFDGDLRTAIKSLTQDQLRAVAWIIIERERNRLTTSPSPR
jgi:hypothetical protein